MTKGARVNALMKLAYFGPASVIGRCTYRTPPPTVGQTIYNINAPYSQIPQYEKRMLTDSIVDTGINVNSPAKSLFHAGIGALAGNFLSNALGAGPFLRGVATTLGASYGYNN